MTDRTAVARFVLEALAAVCPGAPAGDELDDATRLGSEGLGLDSVEVVEVLLACEERYGIAVDGLLEGEPLTIGRIVDHFAAR